MILTAEQLIQLMSSLDGGPAQGTRADQRRTPRIGIRARVEIWLTEKETNKPLGEPISCWLRDVSAGGLGLTLVGMALENGARLAVRMHSVIVGARGIVCEVRHCQEVSKGVFQIGVQFLGQTAEAPKPAAGRNDAPASPTPQVDLSRLSERERAVAMASIMVYRAMEQTATHASPNEAGAKLEEFIQGRGMQHLRAMGNVATNRRSA